ncbi:response regulator [Yersinia mollaretii]|uniref:response regulator n=2 Tax=Yersinia mollaretii TaxID=33060 RepID=UPI0015D51DE8|nr:transporter substrate-binding domain-containing protein [Yersinia mollaretii]MDA5526557.1 transporter substrate-binding domain-containing protein [Yersinia mollaretii]MDR7875741.1 transporter substrate-binding domain-containing protein [Yersinia mollaretii]WQC77045.1 transporter substrate-binding domain-containing protein [Yersinia mollaretii]
MLLSGQLHAAVMTGRQGCDTGQPLSIHSIANSYSEDLLLTPSTDTRQSSRRTVKVGVVIDANTPFVVNRDDNAIEGIVADYLKIISDASQLSFQMIGYCDYGLVLNALENGQIDLMAGTPMPAQPGLIASHAFFTNRHVEVRSKNWDPTKRTHPETVAIVNNEPLSPEFLFNYHADKIVAYPNQLQGLLAVAYGNADVFVSNATSANYLIDQLQLLTLQIRNFAPYHPAPYTFLARESNQKLIDYINQILELLPTRATGDIQQRWFGSKHHYNIDAKLLLTEQEVSWIQKHPVVSYVAPLDLAPLIFRERQTGVMAGFSVDLIDIISRRTGIKFEPVYTKDSGEGVRDFIAGKIDMLPIVAVRNGTYGHNLYSSPVAQSLWGILTREDRIDINNVADLAGKRVGIQAGSTSGGMIGNPLLAQKITFVQAPDTMTLVRWLQQGKVDAVLKNMMTANYLSAQNFSPNIKTVAVAGEEPLMMAFGISPKLPELKAIIDKVIESIPPEELDNLISEWSTFKPNPVSFDSSTLDNELLMVALKISSGLLLIFGLYLCYLVFNKRRQAMLLHTRLLQQESIINALPFAVFIRARNGDLAVYNSHFAAAHQDKLNDMLNQKNESAHWPMTSQLDREIDKYCRYVLLDRKPQMVDLSLEINGEPRDIFLWIIPLDNAERSLLGGWLDISQRKTVERELEAARVEAESANRTKSTFLATISHELRTPMYAIMGLLELEIRSEQPVEKNTLVTVSKTAQSLMLLLDDIIDSAKIEAGQLSVHPAVVDFRQEMERMFTIYQPIADERGLRFTGWLDDQIPQLLMVDMLRVRQVMGNLLGNALKFTEKGSVSVDVTWEPTDDKQGVMNIDITDTGIGISLAAQTTLFQPFSQANEGKSPRFGGSGLGLWICHQLIHKMGGQIILESQLDKGTSLFITLPLAIASEDDIPQDTTIHHADEKQLDHLKNLRVLVVDDLAANRQLLQQQLAFIGIEQVMSADNGAEAWQILQHYSFDVVITDYNMPLMNGYELAAHIRSSPAIKEMIIIGCTADAREESNRRCTDAGMNDCMIKPVTIDTLRTVLLRQEIMGNMGADHHHTAGDNAVSAKNSDASQLPPSPQAAAQEKLRSLSGGSAEVELQLLHSLLESSSQDFEALTQRYQQLVTVNKSSIPNDIYDEMASLVHRIKGGVQLIDAHELVDSCIKFESLLHTHNKSAIIAHGVEYLALLAETHQLLIELVATYTKIGSSDSVK